MLLPTLFAALLTLLAALLTALLTELAALLTVLLTLLATLFTVLLIVDELELLLDGFERSKAGKGQAFSIVAEAGIGKSRLLYEFRKAIANEDLTFLEGKCLSYSGGVAYYPMIDILIAIVMCVNHSRQNSLNDAFQSLDHVKQWHGV